MGRRRWQIHQQPVSEQDLLPDLDLRILRQFDPEQEWILEAGDILYLPPGVAHYGVALEDCLTYSVGFRAPGIADMLTDYMEGEVANADPDKRYRDPDLAPQTHSGEITPAALMQVQHILGVTREQAAHAHQWFGFFITAPSRGQAQPLPLTPPLSIQQVVRSIEASDVVYRSEYFRFAFIEQQGGIQLFINGSGYELSQPIAELGRLIADQRHYRAQQLRPWLSMPEAVELLAEFVNLAYLYLEADDE
jgi:50S ribosomal protein L16 3-hydroxylase